MFIAIPYFLVNIFRVAVKSPAVIVNYVNNWTYILSERSPNRDQTNNSTESEFPRTDQM